MERRKTDNRTDQETLAVMHFVPMHQLKNGLSVFKESLRSRKGRSSVKWGVWFPCRLYSTPFNI